MNTGAYVEILMGNMTMDEAYAKLKTMNEAGWF